MKALILSLTFVACAIGSQLPTLVSSDPPSVVERDIATVTSAVTQVDGSIRNLDQAIRSFNGDATQINSAAQSLVNTLNTATTQIQQSSNLTVEDALSLQSTVSSLQTDGSNLIADLEAKKSAIEAASMCNTIFQQTSSISTAAQNLITAVISKLPNSVQSVGNQLAAGVVATLQQPMMDFSASNCTNAGGSVTSVASLTVYTSTASPFTSFRNLTTSTAFTTATGTSTPLQFTNAAVPKRASGQVGAVAVALAALML